MVFTSLSPPSLPPDSLRAGESTSSDDEDGVLATPKVQEKFLQTLQKLRSKDTSIYDPEHQFFMDEDFEETNETKVRLFATSSEGG